MEDCKTIEELNRRINKFLREQPPEKASLESSTRLAAGCYNRFFGMERAHRRSQIEVRAERTGQPVYFG